jgi:hypothetical protein
MTSTTRGTARQPEITRTPRRSPRVVKLIEMVKMPTMIVPGPRIKTQIKRMKTPTANA